MLISFSNEDEPYRKQSTEPVRVANDFGFFQHLNHLSATNQEFNRLIYLLSVDLCGVLTRQTLEIRLISIYACFDPSEGKTLHNR